MFNTTISINLFDISVTGLLLTTLGLIALAHAHANANKNYHLQCSREEMGIRWPSYKSNSEYYICHRLGDRPMIVNCNDGEVFTFVLQVCTSPSRYIPAPTLDVLPTSSPVAATPFSGHGAINPTGIINGVHPPLLGASHGQHTVQEIPHPPMVVVDAPKPPTMTVTASNQEVVENNKEEEQTPQHPVKPHKPVAKPPMPPTPAPTPPVVGNNEAPAKKPLGKKPTAQKKSPSKKTPSKPVKGSEEKPTNAKAGKKSPKKTPKKTVTSAKKAPKAPKAPIKA